MDEGNIEMRSRSSTARAMRFGCDGSVRSGGDREVKSVVLLAPQPLRRRQTQTVTSRARHCSAQTWNVKIPTHRPPILDRWLSSVKTGM